MRNDPRRSGVGSTNAQPRASSRRPARGPPSRSTSPGTSTSTMLQSRRRRRSTAGSTSSTSARRYAPTGPPVPEISWSPASVPPGRAASSTARRRPAAQPSVRLCSHRLIPGDRASRALSRNASTSSGRKARSAATISATDPSSRCRCSATGGTVRLRSTRWSRPCALTQDLLQPVGAAGRDSVLGSRAPGRPGPGAPPRGHRASSATPARPPRDHRATSAAEPARPPRAAPRRCSAHGAQAAGPGPSSDSQASGPRTCAAQRATATVLPEPAGATTRTSGTSAPRAWLSRGRSRTSATRPGTPNDVRSDCHGWWSGPS